MFKTRNDKAFSRLYLWLVYTSLFVFIVCLGVSAYLLSELPFSTSKTIGIILAIVSIMAFGFCWLIIFTNRKRYISIVEKRKQDKNEITLNSYLKGAHQLNILYVTVTDSTAIKNNSQVKIDEEKIEFDNSAFSWKEIATPEYVLFNGLWFISIGKDKYQTEHWHGILLLSVPEAIKIIEHYLVVIDDSRFKQAETEQKLALESEALWGSNTLLLWEKIAFITISFVIPLLIGLVISLKFKLEDLGIILSTVLSVILIVGVFPSFFARGIKKSYLTNKMGFGHAWGRKSFFIPWENIYSLEVIRRKILIRYHFENEAQTNVGILKIKYDSRVLDEIKKLNQKYLLSIRILDD